MAPNNDPINQEDILETIFSHVPLIHLAPASQVSRTWRRTVSSSLRHLNPVKPWLLIHAQNIRPPYAVTTRAYDPRSRVWVEIDQQPPTKHISPLRSSSSTLLYNLSPATLSFSVDPLHLTWHHVKAPLVWRIDPIVTLVGELVVVAGGACDFEDHPLAVEIYNLKTGAWSICNPMPSELRDSASSTWLSVASDDTRMYLSDKTTGTTFSLDPITGTWCGPYEIRPDPNISSSAIGFVNGRLVLAGLIGHDDEEAESVKMWEVAFLGDMKMNFREIGEMPREMAEKLNCLSSVGMSSSGGFVYFHNPSTAAEEEEVVVCEVAAANERCEWWAVRTAIRSRLMQRMVFTCSSVSMADMQRLSHGNKSRFNKYYYSR